MYNVWQSGQIRLLLCEDQLQARGDLSVASAGLQVIHAMLGRGLSSQKGF